ncbi:MAG: peptidase T [Treponema sp.]|jgi:tripeptide aminopeptidase|nr:peptidase T [Treponema sp.]
MATATETPVPPEAGTLGDLIVPRFLRYVRIWTTSDRRVNDTPSTPGQWELAKVLVQELRDLGLSDVELSEHCYVIARIPATAGRESVPAVGFMAHLDTASDVSGKDVKPVVEKNYSGARIDLAGGLCLDPETEPDLAAHRGRDLIHSDGTTLLGADDKAGIAILMTMLEYLDRHPEIPHGPVEIIFTPDEEAGKGLAGIPLEKIRASACYTLDGGPLGELEGECFNAYKADVEFSGKAIHVGTARGILANAVAMAASYACMLPRSESPEATDGYYGYYCPMDIRGDLENARLEVFLRDFEPEGMRRRMEALEHFARAVESQFPGGTVRVNLQVQYLNMKEKIRQRPEVMELLREAFVRAGVEARLKPVRGGTDGSRLTELGIPTPNIFTGGRNYHSRLEWVSVDEMAAACRVVIELVRVWVERAWAEQT